MKGAVLVVWRKEVRELLKSKSTLIFTSFLALYFGSLPALGVSKAENPITFLNNSIFYLSLTIGLFAGYLFTGQVFFREKQERVVETLLCAPVSLRAFWLGKVLGVATPSYSLSLLATLLLVVVSNISYSPSFSSGRLLFPSAPVLLHLLVVVPLFVASAVGLIGFLQLLLGMRENRIVGLVIFAAVFGALYGVSGAMKMSGGFVVSWSLVAAFLVVSLVLVALTAFLTKFLSKERIVTTIS